MMDKQLIYREDALEIVRRTSGDYAAAFAEISRLPAVDAVQVTRCKDCDGRRVEISWCGTYVGAAFVTRPALICRKMGSARLGGGRNDELDTERFR